MDNCNAMNEQWTSMIIQADDYVPTFCYSKHLPIINIVVDKLIVIIITYVPR